MPELTLKQKNRDLKSIWDFLLFSIIIGIVICFLIGLNTLNMKGGMMAYLELTGACIFIGGASFGIGGLSGFLFGVPKILNSDTNNHDRKPSVTQNDNLVQISDWLTKIIVGVGLTQLNNIPEFLARVGKYFSIIFQNKESGEKIAIAVILYFLIIGFLSVYLWTRLHFIGMVKKVEDDLDKKVNAMAEVINDTQQKMTDLGGGKTISEKFDEVKAEVNNIAANDPDDPQKSKWGGKSESNERKITAKIEPSENPALYKVTLEVCSTNPANPLTGFVKFHLHPTFNNDNPIIAVTDGIARLVLNKVYGAFTAGAEADEGNTRLEIDLAELSGAPQEFRDR